MVIQVDSTELEETGVHFVELVQTLIKDAEQREHFFQVRKHYFINISTKNLMIFFEVEILK